MTDIHPSAIIHKSVELGNDVSVGPYSIIDENVKIDNGTSISAHVVIKANTKIGKNNRVYQFCSIGEEPQYQGYKNEPSCVDIGDNNIIREYCSINRGMMADNGMTKLGSDNFLMAYVHIAHDCIVGNHVIFANAASLAGHVEVGDYAILGGFTIVHQFCNIGQHCITGMGSVCTQDVPPYIVASGHPMKPYGINFKGLRRRDFSEETIHNLRNAYKKFYRQGLSLHDATQTIVEQSQDPHVLQFVNFVNNSKRGVVR